MDKIYFYKQNQDAQIPERATIRSACFDIKACIPANQHGVRGMLLESGKTVIVPTGLNVSMPDDYEMQIRSRSGMAAIHGIFVLNSPGTVDSDYNVLGRDEIKVILHNASNESYVISHGQKIAQAFFHKIDNVELHEIIDSSEWPANVDHDRVGGFGSTGK